MPGSVRITSHVLDVSRGTPAAGITVRLEHRDGEAEDWRLVGASVTNADGRVTDLSPASAPVAAGQYRLTFETRQYFQGHAVATLYPAVIIVIDAAAGESHYHVPLLLSPFGYTTYRGS
jgi:5-hydroxyisourate hydrolase